jgi:hypothetical protein
MIVTKNGKTVQPGDFAAVRSFGGASRLIRIAEWIALRARFFPHPVPAGNENWEHAFFYLGGDDDLILEASPRGAQILPIHYDPTDVLWSTGKASLELTSEQRELAPSVARKYEGTPYSFLEYAAIALHSLHVPAPWLKTYLKSTRHMICSQLVDQCRLSVGSHLFNDNRWPGYVDPLDLALLIEA